MNPVQQTTLPARRERLAPSRFLKLDRAIRMIKERVSSRQTLCHGISFHLDSVSLSQVRLAQTRQQKLHITRSFLQSFRQYVLFDPQGHLQTGVTFFTFYRLGEQEHPLLKTFLSLDGDIVHKIAEECLQDERLAQDLTAAHYWLIQQLFQRLQLEIQQFLDRLSWGSTAVLVGSYWLSQWQQFLQTDPRQKIMQLALTVGGAWFVKVVIRQSLKWLTPWLQRQLMRRLLPS